MSEHRQPGRSRAAGRIRLEVDIHVPPGTALFDSLRWADGLSQADPDRHEIEAFLYLTLARSAWRRADELRAAARKREARQAARGGRAE